MFGKKIKNWAINGARKEVAAYIGNLGAADMHARGAICAHVALMQIFLSQKVQGFSTIIESTGIPDSADLTFSLQETNKLAKWFKNPPQPLNGAAAMAWNNSLRTLRHPELFQYGANLWQLLKDAQQYAWDYLDTLQDFGGTITPQGEKILADLGEAISLLGFVPPKFTQ